MICQSPKAISKAVINFNVIRKSVGIIKHCFRLMYYFFDLTKVKINQSQCVCKNTKLNILS